MNKVAIIILNYNGYPYILDCLKSVIKVKSDQVIKSEIILIDNNSKDNSVQEIEKNYPEIKIIKNKNNLGYAKGNNIGIKYALKKGFAYIMLLNPDTIVNKNFLFPLIQLISAKAGIDNRIGIVAPILMGKEGKKNIFAFGSVLNHRLGRVKHSHQEGPTLDRVGPLEQELVSACAMLIKREVFEKIGLLDERFFMYYEDTDFCLRVRKAGFKIYVEPKSHVYHFGGLSIGGLSLKKIIYIIKGNFLFDLKWVKPWFWPLSFAYLVILGSKMFIDWLALKFHPSTSEESSRLSAGRHRPRCFKAV